MDYNEIPIPLLVAQNDGKYSVTTEAKTIISSIKTPIAVVSVAGLYRTGKSYLLNRMLLNRSSGFGVGPTVNPCTKGLWMWGAPIKTRGEDGQPLTLLIIDTEGLGALDEDENHDNKIFSLAILLSTSFIYNSVGSIDQNAVQSLNLVLNLSETIYHHSSSSKMDTRELPSFFWVVRDFSLQLIDQKGNCITSKDYLQNSLALQKGSSKDVQEKNKIRKFITECFAIRDCFTMVRPTSVDSKLQQLDKVPFEELRPQFVQQVMNLRKRVLGRLQPKKINGNVLDGQSYFNVIKTYVDAINNGAVPNIQSAWEYICLQRNQKLLNQAEQIYLKGVKEQVQYRIPCLDSELRPILENVGRNALKHFSGSAWGEKSSSSKQELMMRIKQKQQSILCQNQKESVVAAQNIISKQYQAINKKLKSGLYNAFSQFQHDIKSFYVFLMEHNRKYQACEMVYMQFINKRILEGSQFFFKSLEQQLNALKQTKNQLQNKTQRENGDLRTQFNRLKTESDTSIGKVQRQKMELQFSLDQLKSQFRDMQVEREQIDIQKQSKITMLTNEVESLSKQLREKETMLQNKVREGMREDCIKNAEWEKEKALHLQQEKFYKQRIELLERKQKQTQQNLFGVKNDLEERIKDITMRNEQKNKSLSQQLMQKSDKLFQATGLVKKLQQDLKILEDSSDLKERKLKNDILDLQTAIEGYRNNDTVERNRMLMDNMNEKRQLLSSLDQEKQKVRILEIQMKQAEEQLKHNKVSFEKDQAIHSQKIQFQQIQLKQLKIKYNQLQTTHQNALLNYQNTSKSKMAQLQNSIIFDLKNSHERQIKQLEAEWESKTRFAKNELENYKRRREELELTLHLQTKKYEDKQFQYKQTIRNLEQACNKIQTEKLTTQQGTAHFKRQIQTRFETKIKRLEHELQNIKEEGRRELNQAHEQSEMTVKQLKSYYELQKQRLQRKIQEQKQKSQKRVRKTIQEYQLKLTEQRVQFQQELIGYKNNLVQIQQSYEQKISNLQYQFELEFQKLNSQLTDRKIQFEKQNALIQQQLDYANKRAETITKEKENIIYKNEEKLRDLRNQLQEEMRQAIARATEQKVLLEQKYEKVKVSLRDSQQNIHKINIEFERERSQLKSKEASLEGRLAEIEEKAKLQVKVVQDKLQKIVEANEIQKKNLFNELEKQRLKNRESQERYTKMIGAMEYEKGLIQNKLNFTQKQGKRYKDQCSDVVLKFQTTVKHLSKQREKMNSEKVQAINEVAISLKDQAQRQAEAQKIEFNKTVSSLQTKIQKLTNQKKVLTDKVLNLQVRVSNQSNVLDSDRKIQKEIDRVRRQYESKIQEKDNYIQNLRREVSLYEGKFGSTSKKSQFDEREITGGKRNNNINIGSALSNKVIPSSNIPFQGRESEIRRNKLTTIPQQQSNISMLGNVSNISNLSQISKKSTLTKQKLYDLGDFGSPYSSKARN